MSFDLDALIAEAEQRPPFEFTFGGEQYELPPDLDITIAVSLSAGDLLGSLQKLLGEEQWARIVASKATFTASAMLTLLERYGEYCGTSLGESAASSRSSKSTVRPSKRTSKGTTKLR